MDSSNNSRLEYNSSDSNTGRCDRSAPRLANLEKSRDPRAERKQVQLEGRIGVRTKTIAFS